MEDSSHAEISPDDRNQLISQLSCSLVGRTEKVLLQVSSKSYGFYQKLEVEEAFRCSFGLNENFREKIGSRDLSITAVDKVGAARILELDNHPFFIATLFLPQLSSTSESPHPLISAFLHAALDYKRERKP